MAKSTRSKVKRTYRAKKREDGVYAAIEAARLARLSAKLKAVASLPTEDEEAEGEGDRADAEGDEVMEDVDAEGVEGEGEKTEGKGWCRDSNDWDGLDFAVFGLLGSEDITLEAMERFYADGGVSTQTATSMILGNGFSTVFTSMAAIALETMDVDGAASSSKSTRVSTHGPRQSRRESWRASKGLAPRPKARGMNRQGTVAAKRKSGRSHRRR